MAQTMKDILNRMLNHEELSREEMKNILIGITHSDYPTEQITALLTALQMRGVTVDELLGFRDAAISMWWAQAVTERIPSISPRQPVSSLQAQVTRLQSTVTMPPPP